MKKTFIFGYNSTGIIQPCVYLDELGIDDSQTECEQFSETVLWGILDDPTLLQQ